MRTTTKVLLGIAIIFFVLPMTALFAYIKYRSYESETFCGWVGNLDTKELIAERARTNGLSFIEWGSPDKVWVFRSEVGPFFRFACAIEFKSGRVVQASMVDAD